MITLPIEVCTKNCSRFAGLFFVTEEVITCTCRFSFPDPSSPHCSAILESPQFCQENFYERKETATAILLTLLSSLAFGGFFGKYYRVSQEVRTYKKVNTHTALSEDLLYFGLF